MTALAMDVRELSFEEVGSVNGGILPLLAIGALLLLGGCAHTKQTRENPCEDHSGNKCPP